MAAVDTTRDSYAQLQRMVTGWDRRWRLTQTVLWLPRAFIPGLIAGIMLAIIARMRPLLTAPTIALIALGAALLGAVIAAAVIWLWRRSLVERARHFDVDFGLGERVSTALELGAGLIRSNDELRALQLADAQTRAAAIRARERLPLKTQPRDWLIVVALAGALAILLLLPNAQAEALEQDEQQEAAIEDAAEAVRDITQDIAADADLGNEERQALLEQLAETIERLEQPNITPEEAFAAVSDMETALRERGEQMGDEAAQNRAALAAAADALREAADGGSSEQQGDQGGDAADMEQVEQNMEQLSENADQLTEEQREMAAEALRRAADALQSTNPGAADALNNAADALENGDTQTAQEQLQSAQDQMRRQNDQAGRQQAQAGEMSDQAERMQDAGEQISQAQEGQPQAGQEGQAQPGDGQMRSEGGQPQDGQPGDQPGDEGQPGGGQQPGDQGQQGGAAQQGGAQGGGAGDDTGEGQGEVGQAVSPPGQGNNPDGEGEGEFERVNVPRRIGGEGGEEIVLEPDASDAPVQEGEFAENPEGQVTVPYNEVFGDYRDAATRALDGGYVPLGLRDVVRDYFIGLEPGP